MPQKTLHIDLDAVLADKLGRKARYVPRFLVSALNRYICVDRMNEILDAHGSLRDAEFCDAVLKHLNVNVEVSGLENMPPRGNRRVILACNHPLGGLDGIALIRFMTDYYGGQIYVVVNDLLMAVEPLRGVFLPVNKHGAQRHEVSRRFDEALDSDNPVLFFPAGLVSRRRNGRVADLPWKKTFVNKAIATGRDIVPIYFDALNSPGFYRMARWRERLGIKFNIEMVRLPAEVFRKENATLRIVCGKPIACGELRGGAQAMQTVARVREAVYALAPEAQKIDNKKQ